MAAPIDLNTTYEDLMAQKLAGIVDSLDKREGGIIFNAIAANSAEIAQMLVTIKNKVMIWYLLILLQESI